MPMSKKALLKRDAKRDIGAELLAAVSEMKSGKVARVHHIVVPVASKVRAKSDLPKR